MGHHTTPTTIMPTWPAQLLTGFEALLQWGGKEGGATCPPNCSRALCGPMPGPPPLLPTHLSTDQVHQLLVADLAPLIALGQGHQHVQLGWIQG